MIRLESVCYYLANWYQIYYILIKSCSPAKQLQAPQTFHLNVTFTTTFNRKSRVLPPTKLKQWGIHMYLTIVYFNSNNRRKTEPVVIYGQSSGRPSESCPVAPVWSSESGGPCTRCWQYSSAQTSHKHYPGHCDKVQTVSTTFKQHRSTNFRGRMLGQQALFKSTNTKLCLYSCTFATYFS